ncbi:hypothetical protein PPTG_24639 [Phytophthora nicotianae INRA-310]|uniref:Uncharacterized protein n=1 Tax=Phytophthora nicotianae (strain INRA-310) TaxID=761204 RepID=W2PDU5_PHYN3|nr:hypothetical protein PPTG_24639 [Phytophthora nicotianae INRA-310]ETM98368.1 hypothetical protein PPTG_24639 [Phytophthora nicotianae INRA-310]
MKMLGTVRISLQGKWIRPALDAAKARMDEAPRGSWELVAALDVPTDWEKLQDAHKRAQKKLPPHLKTDASSEVMIPKPFSCAMILPRFDAGQESKYYIARHSKSLQL